MPHGVPTLRCEDAVVALLVVRPADRISEGWCMIFPTIRAIRKWTARNVVELKMDTWCATCRADDHKHHTDGQVCGRDNNFNANCRCPGPLDPMVFMRGMQRRQSAALLLPASILVTNRRVRQHTQQLVKGYVRLLHNRWLIAKHSWKMVRAFTSSVRCEACFEKLKLLTLELETCKTCRFHLKSEPKSS